MNPAAWKPGVEEANEQSGWEWRKFTFNGLFADAPAASSHIREANGADSYLLLCYRLAFTLLTYVYTWENINITRYNLLQTGLNMTWDRKTTFRWEWFLPNVSKWVTNWDEMFFLDQLQPDLILKDEAAGLWIRRSNLRRSSIRLNRHQSSPASQEIWTPTEAASSRLHLDKPHFRAAGFCLVS